MNAAQLLEHFDRLAEAPGAVARLRRFILDLAVRGKLVAQDPEDEPVVESAPLSESDDPLHVIPASWSWTRISHLTSMVTDGEHLTPPRIFERQVPLVTAKNVRDGEMDYDTTDWVSNETAEKAWRRCRPTVGDILMVCVGATTGRLCVLKKQHDMVLVRSVAVIRPAQNIVSDFLALAIRSSVGQRQIWSNVKVTAQPCLYINRINALAIPLPPLAEQHRIVAKVDELMALCDQLEAAQQERERRRDRLASASLQRLHQPAINATPETQREHARFHLHHLPRLTTRPEHIKAMRQAILNLAVLGLLSESNCWALKSQPLKTVATLQNGYAFKSEWFAKTGIRLLRNTNVSHGIICWDEIACLPIGQSAEYERFQLNEGDVVLSLDRPFIATGTKVARVRAKDLPCLLLQRVGRFQLDHSLLISDYLFLWIESPQFTDQIDPGRSNGVPHISSKQVESAEIFIPPLPEQHRIVAKVDALMALCDQLEAQLTTTQTDSRRLLEAVLEAALVKFTDAPIATS